MQSSRTPRKSCKARRRVQHSLLMRLQDAMTGPPVILSFKSQFGFLIAFAAARRPQARVRAASSLAHRLPRHPSRAPRARRLPVPLPRSSDPASASAGRLLLPQRQKPVDSPPPRRRRVPKQQGQGKVQTGEKIRAPLAQRAKKTNSHRQRTIRPGGSWSPGGCS